MTIVVAGDNRLAQDSLVASINASFDSSPMCLNNLEEVFAASDRIGSISLVLIDYDLGAAKEALTEIRSRLSCLPRVALYSAPGNPDEAMRWLNHGYDGYMPRSMSASAIVCAIQLMMRGERFVPSITIGGALRIGAEPRLSTPALSPRQNEILALVATGASNKHIARALRVEEVTVKSHVKAIFRKLGVHTRTEAARFVLTGPDRQQAVGVMA